MKSIRILVGLTLLFFCTGLIQAQHIRMQDPICNDGIFLETTSSFAFTGSTGSACFFNASADNWDSVLVQIDPSAGILASNVFCDSPPNIFGTAFSGCDINSNSNGIVTSIFFTGGGCELPGFPPDSNSGDPCNPKDNDPFDDFTGIPRFSFLILDLNSCGTRGENCQGNDDSGFGNWVDKNGNPINFTFTANVPEPTSIVLLGTGLLVGFRKRFFAQKK